MVSTEERKQIQKRMEKAGISNTRAYLLQLALTGSILQLDLPSIREMIKLLSTVTLQIEQLTMRLNDIGQVDAETLTQLTERSDEIWRQTKTILLELAKL